jgi:eukaryotic-like serine/threonine-protein kinase
VPPANTNFENAEESRAFLQRRVSGFGIWGSCLGWLFLFIRTIDLILGRDFAELVEPSYLFHAVAAACLLLLGLLNRTGRRTVRFIRTSELVLTLASCTFYSLMGLTIWPYVQPHYLILLALGLGLITRAIYVPSSFSWSLRVTGLPGIPFLIVTYLLYRDLDWAPLAPQAALFFHKPELELRENLDSRSMALGVVVFAAAWWVCILAICASASRIIYGLRKQVHSAMQLGQYTLVEKLGEGGMGAVYRAKHAMLRRPTALKLLPVDKSSAEAIARFEKEVQLTAMLTHPNTVTIFDYGRTPDRVFYYVMELLEGATLTDVVESTGPLPASRVVRILRHVAGALAEAHGVHLIHRDIKPSNIMLVEQGARADVAKVLDFGLVKQLDHSGDAALTQEDSITGTPHYLSPEAITNPDAVDARSDIYALGAVGYYLLTGETVFTSGTIVAICSDHLHAVPQPPSERLGAPVPRALEELILKCLKKVPAERPQTADEIESALEHSELADDWTDQKARAWWTEHRSTLERARSERAISETDRTVAVDFAEREAMPMSSHSS